MRLYTAQQVRELDRTAIEEHHIPGYELMQRAAGAVFDCLKQNWPDAKEILLVCGAGNNAGDGFVLARLCQQANLNVRVLCVSAIEKLQGDALTAYESMLDVGIRPETDFTEPPSDTVFKQSDLIIDALFGTGLDRPLEGLYASFVHAINQVTTPVLSIDIPSGLHADSGMPLGVAVHANRVVSFIGQKRGLFTGLAKEYYQALTFDPLSVPAETYHNVPAQEELLDYESVKPLLRKRSLTAHKGSNGHLLCIGGDSGYAGAIRMAAETAVRSGAGLVSIATRKEHAHQIHQARPELMCHAVDSYKELDALVKKASVILVGPGLGQSVWAQELLARIREVQKPMVFDADALNLIADDPDRNDQRIITPHPGEAARLLHADTKVIQSDRFKALQELQQRYGGSVVLKGSGSLISHTDNSVSVCAHGNPGMGSGGMGDVLSGLIAALLAQGYSHSDSSVIGTIVHSKAADILAEQDGEIGLLATDLIPVIRALLNKKL